jgi:hypothetical protein
VRVIEPETSVAARSVAGGDEARQQWIATAALRHELVLHGIDHVGRKLPVAQHRGRERCVVAAELLRQGEHERQAIAARHDDRGPKALGELDREPRFAEQMDEAGQVRAIAAPVSELRSESPCHQRRREAERPEAPCVVRRWELGQRRHQPDRHPERMALARADAPDRARQCLRALRASERRRAGELDAPRGDHRVALEQGGDTLERAVRALQQRAGLVHDPRQRRQRVDVANQMVEALHGRLPCGTVRPAAQASGFGAVARPVACARTHPQATLAPWGIASECWSGWRTCTRSMCGGTGVTRAASCRERSTST